MAIPEYISREIAAMNAAQAAAQAAADASWAQSGLCGSVVVTVAKRRVSTREQVPDLRQFEMRHLWEK